MVVVHRVLENVKSRIKIARTYGFVKRRNLTEHTELVFSPLTLRKLTFAQIRYLEIFGIKVFDLRVEKYYNVR